jgi:hypothetical protein
VNLQKPTRKTKVFSQARGLPLTHIIERNFQYPSVYISGMTAMMMHTYTALQPVLDRLSRRFRFDVMPNENGTTLEADDLTLHILSDGRDYMVIFEPFDSCETPIHVAARESEIEAVLRELLAA